MGMLKNGIPSGATLCRVENGIDDLAMADSMQAFAENFRCNKSQIILNTANSPIKFQNYITNVCLHSPFF